MKGEHLERWRYLAARVVEEQDRETFELLVKELLHELQLKEDRLKGNQTIHKDTVAE